MGDLVRVTGTAGEFEGQTQIGSVTAIRKLRHDATVAPIARDARRSPDALDDAERFEGMLVRLPQSLVVTEHFQLGRFGQVTLSSAGEPSAAADPCARLVPRRWPSRPRTR